MDDFSAQLPSDPASLQAIILGLHAKLQQRDAVIAQHQAVIAQQAQTLEASTARIGKLEQQLTALIRHRYGPRSEKINANQLLLFGQDILPLTDAVEPKQTPAEVSAKQPKPKGHGRRIIPADVQRVTVTHDVPEEEKTCTDCHEPKVQIRQIVTEQLEYIPARLYVLRHVQFVYACAKGCDGQMQTAEKPACAVEKGLAGPGLVAHVITAKYADHLPLYRQEGIFARHGIQISRSTMCGWAGEVARLCRPLVELMRQKVLTGRVIHTDDTPVPVQDEQKKGKTRQGRLWIYLGEPLVPYVVYDYTANRSSEGPKAWLKDYGGYLQCDAYSGYEFAFKEGGAMTEVACWAHARRKFFEARELAPAICHEALAFISRLYDVEREGRELGEEQRLALRREKSVPILDEIEQWKEKARPQVLPKNPAYEALTYLSNQWEALRRYTTRGWLNIDNNPAERALRRVAIGRKNWLFAGSDEGGRTAATLYSLIASAERHGLNVEAYLRGLFAQLPGSKLSDLPRFLPDAWKADLAKEAVTATPPAAANP